MSGRRLTPSEQVMLIRGLGRIGERAKADEFMAGYFFFVDDDDEANWLAGLMQRANVQIVFENSRVAAPSEKQEMIDNLEAARGVLEEIEVRETKSLPRTIESDLREDR